MLRTNGAVAICLNVVAAFVIGGALSGCKQDPNSNAAGQSGPSVGLSAGTTSLTLSWDAPTDNTDGSLLRDLKGYKIYYGEKSGSYSLVVDLPNPSLTTYVVQNLAPGAYYFALADYNSQGAESLLTREISVVVD